MNPDFNLALGSWRTAAATSLGSFLLSRVQISRKLLMRPLELTALCVLSLGTFAGQTTHAAEDEGVIRYSATTANLDPEGVRLRIDVLRWSDDADTSAIIAALRSDDVPASINDVPTVGYIWPDGSPVGYSLKYAGREVTDAGERLTFVTSKTLGSYEFGGWTVRGQASADELDYTVIELDVSESGNGTGLASLATPVAIDADTRKVSLDRAAGPLELFVVVHRIRSGY